MALTKIDDRGLKTPVDLLDDEKIRFGTGNDLEIYHSGSGGRIKNTTGGFYIDTQVANGEIRFTSNNVNENMIRAVRDAEVELYHNGGKKLSTTANGIEIHDLDDTTVQAKFHAQDWNSGGSTTGSIYGNSGTNPKEFGLLDATGEWAVKLINDAGVELYYNGTKHFETNSGGVKVNDSKYVAFGNGNDFQIFHDGNNRICADSLYINNLANNEQHIYCHANGRVELFYNNAKKIETTSSGVDIAGNCTITGNFRGNDNVKLNLGNSDDLQIWHGETNSGNDEGQNYINAISGKNICLQVNSDSNGVVFHKRTGTGTLAFELLAGFTAGGNNAFYYDGSKKAETTNSGLRVYSNLDLEDNEKIRLGNGDDFEIYHDGSNSLINDGGTGNLKLQCAGNTKLEITSTGANIGSHVFTTGGDYTCGNNIYIVDGGRIGFGASEDLKIYHDGNHSYIKDSGTGNLQIVSNQTNIQDADQSHYQAKFIDGGDVELFYDGSKKIETTSTGVDVTGTVKIKAGGQNYTDGLVIEDYDSTSKSGITHVNGILYMSADGSTDHFQVHGNGTIHLGADFNTHISHPASDYLRITTNGNTVMDFTDASNVFMPDNRKLMFGTDTDLKIWHGETNSGNNEAQNYIEADPGKNIIFNVNGDGDGIIFHKRTGTGLLAFEVLASFAAGGACSLRYDSNEKLTTHSSGVTIDEDLYGGSSGADGSLWNNTGAGERGWAWQNNIQTFTILNNSEYACEYINKVTAGSIADTRFIDFRWNGDQVGTMNYTNNDVVLTQQSDYRLKENIVGITDGITKVKQLNPVKFNFKSDAPGKDSSILNEGFLAHELQAVIPQAAYGTKDGTKVNEEGQTVPDYQEVYTPKMVPILTAALKEAIAKIETLETKVAALEGG